MEKYGEVKKGRVRDFGQLRYAMRSVFMHANPYVRNFIVVVSSKQTQTPSWLNTTHPRVRVVEHKEIWDNTTNLPSMNSHAIEWATMNIPDLSPQYLYLNDDFAITKKLDLATIWRGPNKYILWEAWQAPRSRHQVGDAYGKALAFVRTLYDKKYRRVISRRVGSHIPMLFDRAVMQKIKDDFPKEFKQMYNQKPFRTTFDMQFQFAYQQYIKHHYKFKMAPEPHVHFSNISEDYEKNKKVFDGIHNKTLQYMCLQDDFKHLPSKKVLDQIRGFYNDMFPIKGPWEKSY